MKDKTVYQKGNQTKGMMVCEKIVENLQKEGGQKERFKLIERDDIKYGEGTNTTPSSVQKRIPSDIVDYENNILAVFQGRFPK